MNPPMLLDYFFKGGPIMWPILICSLIAMTTVVERVMFIYKERKGRNPGRRHELMQQIEQGYEPELTEPDLFNSDRVIRVLAHAMPHRNVALTESLQNSCAEQLEDYERGVAVLDGVITVAPLLGLLGTVTGMIKAFASIGGEELSSPAGITGGIGEALIATACGLTIAILCLIPFNYLVRLQEKVRRELEDAATRLEIAVKGQASAATTI